METRIVNHADQAHFELVETKTFSIGYYSQKHPYKSGCNEDALGFITNGQQCFLVIADGVGGCPQGEVASTLSITTIIHSLKKLNHLPKDLSHFRQYVLDAIEQCSQKLRHSTTGARTTFTACLITDNIAQSIQVGDSSLIICGQKGLLKHKTLEHSPVGLATAIGLLSEKEAMIHPQRHIVTNILGEADMHIDIGPQILLNNHDTILLASDGLYDNFFIDELIEIIRKESITEVLQKLTNQCQPMRLENKTDNFYKIDDVSFIVCRHKGAY